MYAGRAARRMSESIRVIDRVSRLGDPGRYVVLLRAEGETGIAVVGLTPRAALRFAWSVATEAVAAAWRNWRRRR